jgi:hypothetical protein
MKIPVFEETMKEMDIALEGIELHSELKMKIICVIIVVSNWHEMVETKTKSLS